MYSIQHILVVVKATVHASCVHFRNNIASYMFKLCNVQHRNLVPVFFYYFFIACRMGIPHWS